MASRRIRSAIALTALSVVGLLPGTAGAAIENYWDGVWNSRHEGTKLMVMRLNQSQGSTTVTGTYSHPQDKGGDRGKVYAEASGKFGKVLKGTYVSNKSGRGGFKLKLLGNDNSFSGEFWPCRYRFYCDVLEWTGNHPEFD